jgi:hypothetical protein
MRKVLLVSGRRMGQKCMELGRLDEDVTYYKMGRPEWKEKLAGCGESIMSHILNLLSGTVVQRRSKVLTKQFFITNGSKQRIHQLSCRHFVCHFLQS